MLQKPNETLKLFNQVGSVIEMLRYCNSIRLLKSEHNMFEPAVVNDIRIPTQRRCGVAICFEGETGVLCVGCRRRHVLTCLRTQKRQFLNAGGFGEESVVGVLSAGVSAQDTTVALFE